MQGKLNPQSADLSIDTAKNTFYLVLISENFVEARAALSHSATNLPQTQSPVKVDRATVAPSLPVTGQPPAPVTSGSSTDNTHFSWLNHLDFSLWFFEFYPASLCEDLFLYDFQPMDLFRIGNQFPLDQCQLLL